MDVLLDTHAFLWWATSDPQLSPHALNTIADRSNRVLISAVIGWEISIKVCIGRYLLATSVDTFVESQIAVSGFVKMPIALEDTYGVSAIPLYHRDPFDRLLIAQAIRAALPIVTCDGLFAPYGVTTIW